MQFYKQPTLKVTLLILVSDRIAQFIFSNTQNFRIIHEQVDKWKYINFTVFKLLIRGKLVIAKVPEQFLYFNIIWQIKVHKPNIERLYLQQDQLVFADLLLVNCLKIKRFCKEIKKSLLFSIRSRLKIIESLLNSLSSGFSYLKNIVNILL